MRTGEQLFQFGSGNLALDLLNTWRTRDGTVVDALGAPEDVLTWIEGAGLSGQDRYRTLRAPPVARVLLTEARRLRDDLEHLVEAHRAGVVVAPHVLHGINRVLDASRASAWLRVEAEGPRLLEREVGDGPLAALAPIARAAAVLIKGTVSGRIRRCASDDCTRWFVDTSKGGGRKWCSMATCGNRAKAAKHRQRTATS